MVSINRHAPSPGSEPSSSDDPGQARHHRIGDGFHPLPLHCVTDSGIEQLTSAGCILLLFTIWAQRAGFDAVEIYARANPDAPRLRPDLLLFYRQWTEVPDDLAVALLREDLKDINELDLDALIGRMESGAWRPPRAYTHWVITGEGRIVGEARDLDPPDRADDLGQHFCFVRLFDMPDMAEWGYSDAGHLVPKAPR